MRSSQIVDFTADLSPEDANTAGALAAMLGIEQLVMLTEAGIFDGIIGRTKFILVERQESPIKGVWRERYERGA